MADRLISGKACIYNGENWKAFRCIICEGGSDSPRRPFINISDSPTPSGTSAVLGKAILGKMILGKVD